MAAVTLSAGAHQPQQNVERMRAQIGESAAAGLIEIRHPAPIGVEPALQRAGVAVAMPDARDLAKMPQADLLAQELMDRAGRA